jgi:hypothetical protein
MEKMDVKEIMVVIQGYVSVVSLNLDVVIKFEKALNFYG